jgi:hypothetical protein
MLWAAGHNDGSWTVAHGPPVLVRGTISACLFCSACRRGGHLSLLCVDGRVFPIRLLLSLPQRKGGVWYDQQKVVRVAIVWHCPTSLRRLRESERARDVDRDGDCHRNVGIWMAMLVSLSFPLSLSMDPPLRQNGTTVCASRTPVIDPVRVVAIGGVWCALLVTGAWVWHSFCICFVVGEMAVAVSVDVVVASLSLC